MEVRFKQTNGYGCGLYALQNLFIGQSIITDKRIAESRDGNNTHQLNRWLRKDTGYTIDALYAHFDSHSFPLPPKGTRFMPVDDCDVLPILIDTATTVDGKKHLVCAVADSNGDVAIIDSLKAEVIVTKWEHLISGALYNFVIAIYGITKGNGNWVTLINSGYYSQVFK